MPRTIISLDAGDKAWLDRKAKESGVPMTEMVREAVRRLRREHDAPFEKILQQTRGLWRKGDGPAYQRRLRREWR